MVATYPLVWHPENCSCGQLGGELIGMEDYLNKCWLSRYEQSPYRDGKVPSSTLQGGHPHCGDTSSDFHSVLCPHGKNEYDLHGEGNEPAPMQIIKFNFAGNNRGRATYLKAGRELPWTVYFMHHHGLKERCSCPAESIGVDPLTSAFQQQLSAIRLRQAMIYNEGQPLEIRWVGNNQPLTQDFLSAQNGESRIRGRNIVFNSNDSEDFIRNAEDVSVNLSKPEEYNFSLWEPIRGIGETTMFGHWLDLNIEIEDNSITKTVYTGNSVLIVMKSTVIDDEEFLKIFRGFEGESEISDWVIESKQYLSLKIVIDDGNSATNFLNHLRRWLATEDPEQQKLHFRRKTPFQLLLFDEEGLEIESNDNIYNLNQNKRYFARIHKPSSRRVLPLDKFQLNITSPNQDGGVTNVSHLPIHQPCQECDLERCNHFPKVFYERVKADLWFHITCDSNQLWYIDIDRFQTTDDKKMGGSDMRVRYTLDFSVGDN
jgi:hypothetical protein